MNLDDQNTLITAVPAAIARADFEGVVTGLGQGAALASAPGAASYANLVRHVVNEAAQGGWGLRLVDGLLGRTPANPSFIAVRAALAQPAVVPTTADLFAEVLLDGDRPFVNRRTLRGELRRLLDPVREPLLLVGGEKLTGKSFSFNLVNHIASRKGYAVLKFSLAQLPAPDELAAEILRRFSLDGQLAPRGTESAERWAVKLADEIAHAMRNRPLPRVVVVDDLSDTQLPDGTESLIVRLAQYADEERSLRLRMVLVRFREDALPAELADIVLRDDATRFSDNDMVQVVTQIARARGWVLSDAVVKERIATFEAAPRTLQDRFRFLRKLLRELDDSAKQPPSPGAETA